VGLVPDWLRSSPGLTDESKCDYFQTTRDCKQFLFKLGIVNDVPMRDDDVLMMVF